jgi:hypothetical protein
VTDSEREVKMKVSKYAGRFNLICPAIVAATAAASAAVSKVQSHSRVGEIQVFRSLPHFLASIWRTSPVEYEPRTIILDLLVLVAVGGSYGQSLQFDQGYFQDSACSLPPLFSSSGITGGPAPHTLYDSLDWP